MRIEKASLALDPAAVNSHFSLAGSLEQQTNNKSTAVDSKRNMSTLVNGPTQASLGSQHRANTNSNYQTQPQSRAILSALKHEQLSSTTSPLISPPPVVSSSSHKLGKIMEEADTYNPTMGTNGNLANYLMQGNNLLDQNSMLVTSLPPVETIFQGDRGMLNGSMSNIQQQQQQVDDSDLAMNSFAPTTIINEHHIDYYGQGMSDTYCSLTLNFLLFYQSIQPLTMTTNC